jgi:hypothetical protein
MKFKYCNTGIEYVCLNLLEEYVFSELELCMKGGIDFPASFKSNCLIA